MSKQPSLTRASRRRKLQPRGPRCGWCGEFKPTCCRELGPREDVALCIECCSDALIDAESVRVGIDEGTILPRFKNVPPELDVPEGL